MKSNRLFLLIACVLLVSCRNENDDSPDLPEITTPGIVLTFDDDYVDEWNETQQLLHEYDWKATFFVTKFSQLTPEEILKLKALKNYGHEIGGHGVNHLNASVFISQYGAQAYLDEEIYPMIDAMDNQALPITSFAYPYGARTLQSDGLLLNEFQMLRGTTYGNPDPASQHCYYNHSRLVLGLGLDNNYSHFSIPYFLSLLEYARLHNKIIIFYAHRPVAAAMADYETEFQTLTAICDYAKSNHMKFYTISELYDL